MDQYPHVLQQTGSTPRLYGRLIRILRDDRQLCFGLLFSEFGKSLYQHANILALVEIGCNAKDVAAFGRLAFCLQNVVVLDGVRDNGSVVAIIFLNQVMSVFGIGNSVDVVTAQDFLSHQFADEPVFLVASFWHEIVDEGCPVANGMEHGYPVGLRHGCDGRLVGPLGMQNIQVGAVLCHQRPQTEEGCDAQHLHLEVVEPSRCGINF